MILDENEQILFQASIYALNKLAEIFEYQKTWSDDFCKSEAIEAFEKIQKHLNKFDVYKIPNEESLNKIGIGNYGKFLKLCPLYLHQKYFPEVNNDHRGFCLAFGWEWDGEKIIPSTKHSVLEKKK